MASAWGKAWGVSFGSSWGIAIAPPPPQVWYPGGGGGGMSNPTKDHSGKYREFLALKKAREEKFVMDFVVNFVTQQNF